MARLVQIFEGLIAGTLKQTVKIDTATNAVTNAGTFAVQQSGFVAATGSHDQVTVDDTAGGKALTSAKYGANKKAFIKVAAAQIRFTIDGTAPTSTLGFVVDAGSKITLDSAHDIAAFRAIRTTAVSAVIDAVYGN